MKFSHRLYIGLFTLLFLVGYGGVIVYVWRSAQQSQKIAAEINEALSALKAMDQLNANFPEIATRLKTILVNHEGAIPVAHEAIAKLRLANAVSEVNPAETFLILKDVASNTRYPPDVRVWAMNALRGHLESYFIDKNFARDIIFSGPPYDHFFSEAGENDELALRLFSESSYGIFPNATAAYLIAQWYATEIYRKPMRADKNILLKTINDYLTRGDLQLEFHAAHHKNFPEELVSIYERKARILSLSGSDWEEVERVFNQAEMAYKQPPQKIQQIINFGRTRLFYASFLARQFGVSRIDDIERLLKPLVTYLSTPQEPRRRNVHLVSFLIAARDSRDTSYPVADFNQKDIEQLGLLYPPFREAVNNLALHEYVKGHPLEGKL